MKCPFCSNRLRQVKSESAIVDICPNCKGVWFDSGEFADLAKTLEQSNQISAQKIKLYKRRDVRALHTVEEKDKFCPKCGKKLRKFNYSYDSNVFLDKCPACGGIWADRGEVAAIVSYLKEDPVATAVGRALAEQMARPDYEAADESAGWFFPLRIIVPLSDDTPRDKFPIVTLVLVISCVLTFVGEIVFNPDGLVEVVDTFSKNLFSLDLVASIFSYGGVFHLIWNMLFLWLFGDNVEDRFGRFGYLVFFLGCALFAGLLRVLFSPGLSIWVMGISGAVSGVMGAYFIFYPAAKIKMFVIFSIMEVPAAVCLGLWFLFQFIFPFLTKAEDVTFTANIVPIVGFVCGVAIAYIKKFQHG
ncbi:MAG: rhomboid family intramembrane serine protease [Planctomycetota bacterium]|jgi:membrane associated rhomboid family serine protease